MLAIKDHRYGGILFKRNDIYILITEIDVQSFHWKFPVGSPNENETDEEAALRNVFEQTGYDASIISKIDKEFHFEDGIHHYYVMKVNSEFSSFTPEHIQQAWWLTPEVIINNYIKPGPDMVNQSEVLNLLELACDIWKKSVDNGIDFSPDTTFDES